MTTNTFSLSEFIAFCRSKPAGERYSINAQHCALAQFGFPEVHDDTLAEMGVPQAVFDAAMGGIEGNELDLTFGALASRLSKLSEGE